MLLLLLLRWRPDDEEFPLSWRPWLVSMPTAVRSLFALLALLALLDSSSLSLLLLPKLPSSSGALLLAVEAVEGLRPETKR